MKYIICSGLNTCCQDQMDKQKKIFLALYHVCFIDWLLISLFPKDRLFGKAEPWAKMLVYHHTKQNKDRRAHYSSRILNTSHFNEGRISC